MAIESPAEQRNLSHAQETASFEAAVQKIRDKIIQRGNLPYIPVNRQLELLDLLAQCALGRFLIETGGLNGYWTYYVTHYPTLLVKPPLNAVEAFLLNQAPFGLATQQRHQIFKKELQKRVVEGAVLASAPCGLMADLLELDFSGISHFALTGIDLDTETLGQAKSLAASHGLSERCEFLQRDAWDLETEERFDVLTSNGLSIYEPSEARVVDLYREFFKALKPGGHLIASFLTPPPVLNPASEWNLSKINQTDALMQKILLADIINSKWQTFRTSEAVKRQLESAGFEAIEFIYDEASIFPTVTARKPL